MRRYRPSIEGLFSRIERWAAVVHWRSISRDNATTLLGREVARGSRTRRPAGERHFHAANE